MLERTTYDQIKNLMLLMESAENLAVLMDWLDDKLDAVDDEEVTPEMYNYMACIREDPQYKLMREEARSIRYMLCK